MIGTTMLEVEEASPDRYERLAGNANGVVVYYSFEDHRALYTRHGVVFEVAEDVAPDAAQKRWHRWAETLRLRNAGRDHGR